MWFLLEVSIYGLKNEIFSEDKLGNVFINAGGNYKWLSKVNHNSKVLLMGSSSVRYGLSCSLLDSLSKDSLSFINLGMDARDPIESYFILKQIDLKNVKAVYFGLDPWIYTKNYYLYRNNYLYLDINFFQGVYFMMENDRNFYIKKYKSFFRYFLSMSFRPIEQNSTSNYNIPVDFGSEKLLKKPTNFNQPVNELFKINKLGWSQLQFVYLTKIADLCKSKDIYFSSFVPPKGKDYSQTYKLKCKSIHDEFISHLIYVDFAEPIFGVYDQLDKLGGDDLFLESYHLNSHGQEVYSSIFYSLLSMRNTNVGSEYQWFANP